MNWLCFFVVMLIIPKLIKKVCDIKNYVEPSEDMKVLSASSQTLNSITIQIMFWYEK